MRQRQVTRCCTRPEAAARGHLADQPPTRSCSKKP